MTTTKRQRIRTIQIILLITDAVALWVFSGMVNFSIPDAQQWKRSQGRLSTELIESTNRTSKDRSYVLSLTSDTGGKLLFGCGHKSRSQDTVCGANDISSYLGKNVEIYWFPLSGFGSHESRQVTKLLLDGAEVLPFSVMKPLIEERTEYLIFMATCMGIATLAALIGLEFMRRKLPPDDQTPGIH